MQESKDPAIRLFGRKIPLQSDGKDPSISGDKEEGGGKIADKDEDEADKESAAAIVTENPEEKEKDSEHPSSTDEEEASKSSEKEKKSPKKPEKLVPCPRCKSMDTKFCYFNNYNVNQPRHFCKSCQRYWTAGGAIRNVPVGAGRRKTGKNPSSNHRHIFISEALQARIGDDHNNGKVLNFGLNPRESAKSEGTPNGFHRFGDNKTWVPSKNEASMEIRESGTPFLNAVPWAFPPVSLYHPYAVSGNWNWNFVPWLKAEYVQREEKEEEEEEGRGCKSEERNGGVLVPKTLRIDDASMAGKSSIWERLGIKRERGMFEELKKKKEDGEKKMKKVETCMVLRANPAALSRSLNFHENS